MAHKKGQGTSRNGRDSSGQRRGVKVYAGQPIRSGGIIIRQVGSVFRAGVNVGVGRDWTIYSYIDGVVKFESGRRVSVYPPVAAAPRAVNKEPAPTHGPKPTAPAKPAPAKPAKPAKPAPTAKK